MVFFIIILSIFFSFREIKSAQIQMKDLENIEFDYLSKKPLHEIRRCKLKVEKSLLLVAELNPVRFNELFPKYKENWKIAASKVLHCMIKRVIQLNSSPELFIDYKEEYDINNLKKQLIDFTKLTIKPSYIPDCNDIKNKFAIPAEVTDSLVSDDNLSNKIIQDRYNILLLCKNPQHPQAIKLKYSTNDLITHILYHMFYDLLIRYYFIHYNFNALTYLIIQPHNFIPNGLWNFYNQQTSNDYKLLDITPCGLFYPYKDLLKQKEEPILYKANFYHYIDLNLFHNKIAHYGLISRVNIFSIIACVYNAQNYLNRGTSISPKILLPIEEKITIQGPTFHTISEIRKSIASRIINAKAKDYLNINTKEMSIFIDRLYDRENFYLISSMANWDIMPYFAIIFS